MSSHYDPIPIESDPEEDVITRHSPMQEDDTRTERTRSTDRSNFFHEHTTDSDSDPEEYPPSADDRTPLITTNSETRPFGQFAGAQTSTPSHHEETESYFSTPPSTSNARTTAGFHIWERTLRTLKRWRDNYQQTPTPQMESSSSIRQEFLLDTTPIIVDKVTRHEERLDMMEDIVMDLPGPETLAEFRYEIDTTDSNVAYVNDQVQTLKNKVERLTQNYKDMDHSIDRMERQMWDYRSMTAAAVGTTHDNLRTYFGNFPGRSSGTDDSVSHIYHI